ncbi:MAG TPA: response regulator [bacterium]|nr:response regulator [bacterium]HOL47020.1 response regulator [bacterium]HPQ18478.1 response regulator [bacterium]
MDDKPIVIIDDDETILEMLKDVLTTENYKVIIYNEPKKALNDIINGLNCFVILTDIAMPELDGYSLYQKIKQKRDDIEVIFMTGFGYDFKHTIVRAKLEGLKYCLYKPFEPIKLFKILNKIKEEKK